MSGVSKPYKNNSKRPTKKDRGQTTSSNTSDGASGASGIASTDDSTTQNASTATSSGSLFSRAPVQHPVDSTGKPTLRIVIPTTSPVANQVPIAPTISNQDPDKS